ncbi:MAG: chromate resistance protein [Deltaproteobacteria bacterium]|nr:chromate resistance protein [Deltaproteobacteria bacterium]
MLGFETFGEAVTHAGDRCSFEVLAASEIIHDLDLRDAKFIRPEAAGVGAVLNGICWAHPDDGRLRAARSRR